MELKNHLTLTLSHEINTICQPLIQLGITFFSFDRVYKNNSRSVLSNSPNWIDHYYKSEYYKIILISNTHLQVNPSYVLWSHLTRDPVYTVAAEFGIGLGISLIQKEPECYEYYHFASDENNKKVHDQYLIDNIPYLKRFIQYFKDKSQILMKQVDKKRIFLPEKPLDFIIQSENIVLSDIDSYKKFIDQTEIKRYYLGNEFPNIYLTKQEIHCIHFLMKGHTFKRISNNLKIAERTVINHITNVRKKLGCKTLCELGVKLAKIKILDFLLES